DAGRCVEFAVECDGRTAGADDLIVLAIDNRRGLIGNDLELAEIADCARGVGERDLAAEEAETELADRPRDEAVGIAGTIEPSVDGKRRCQRAALPSPERRRGIGKDAQRRVEAGI